METIRYDDTGSGFPIVWIHGFPLSPAIFEPQLAIQGFRHLRPHLRGFGSTPPPSVAMSMADYARDVVGVMIAAGVERAVIAGFSMGGYIAMQMLRDAPRRFAGLLLLDTRELADTGEVRANRLRQAAEVEATGTTRSVVEAMLPKLVFSEGDRPRVRAIMESASPRGVVAALEAMAGRPDSTGTLRGVRVPTLVVVGDRDEITPAADAERMAALIPGAQLAPIAKAGHMANFERPEQLNPLLAAFLTDNVLRHEHAQSL